MHDVFTQGLIRSASITLGIATTTQTCRRAQESQTLAPTSSVALGRLLTSTALLSNAQGSPQPLSLQVLCQGRLQQIFADINDAGDLRGYIKDTQVALPLFSGEVEHGRRSLAPVVGQGVLSVIRMGPAAEFGQSSTPLVSGEIDEDVQLFLRDSDQIEALLVADVILERDSIAVAGGLVIACLPQADKARFSELAAALKERSFADRLWECRNDPQTLMAALASDAKVTQSSPLQWKCRCSRERVLASLRMLTPADLADMVDKKEPAEVQCDFCKTRYEISPDSIEEVFLQTITARG